MTRKRRRSSKKTQTVAGGLGLVAVLFIGCILVVLFLFTGEDPAGLFGESPEQRPKEVVIGSTRTGSGGDWWQVYFSEPGRGDPQNLAGTIGVELIDLVDSAQQSIHIAAFEFNQEPLAAALIDAQARGVEVLWLADDENGIEEDEFELGLFEMLEDEGIEVRDDGRDPLMHNKFVIIDENTVWTGSTNLTQNGVFRNNNNVLVIESPEFAAIYEQEFQEMWGGDFGARAPSNVERQSLTIDDTPIQVLFSAEDHPVSALVPIIESAEESIRFMAFSFTHDELGAAVLERFEDGVDVKGIFETRASETEFSELSRLYCSRVPVLQDGNPGALHHKVFIIDDRIVITGSANFSNNADNFNDENLIILANEDIARAYQQEFDRRWFEASDPEGLEC